MSRAAVDLSERKRIIVGFDRSSSTLSDYCASQDITVHQYYRWRRELFGAKYKKRESGASFLELSSQSAPSNPDQRLLQFEIEISGILIRVRK